MPSLPSWLNDAVLYNIYPQSYRDTNGDGIGDLPGILEKLDYIQNLGVTALWLNPIYPSPFQDAGYDITDYCRIAPRYGTMADFRRLVSACHRRGLRLILDFVPGHTSNQHPWFRQSSRSKRNPRSDWYIWTDSGFGNDGDPRLIRGYCDRNGHYKPNFFWFQPSLNYGYARRTKSWQLPVTHPAVRQVTAEMKRIMRHWLDLGVDGFRVDMAASLIKNDPDSRANQAFWRRIRRWIDRDYPERVLISEWSWPTRAIAGGFHIDFMIHFNNDAYNSLFRLEPGRNIFPSRRHSFFDRLGKGNIREFLDHYEPFLRQTRRKGFISLPTGNHDLPRLNHRRSVAELKVAHAFLFTMPGVPTLYYGDEIGLRNLPSAPNKEGGYVRTQARTPMQWDASPGAGFSNAPRRRYYLPLDPSPDRPNVASQDKNSRSLLTFVRQLIGLRHQHPALGAAGNYETLLGRARSYPYAYLRSARGSRFLVVLNPAAAIKRSQFLLPRSTAALRPVLVHNVRCTVRRRRVTCDCGPMAYGIFELANAS